MNLLMMLCLCSMLVMVSMMLVVVMLVGMLFDSLKLIMCGISMEMGWLSMVVLVLMLLMF